MKNGFTLVELSIVLVIIGLLVGGVLVGQSLIDSARINAQVSQMQQFSTMVRLFEDKFRQIPGDSNLMSPQGNNNGLITGFTATNTVIETGFAYSSASATSETAFFWKHLSDAGITQEKYTNVIDPSGTQAGVNYPEGKFDGIIANAHSVAANANLSILENSNHFLMYSASEYDNEGRLNNQPPAFGVVTVLAIDQKTDDGLPYAGNVNVLPFGGTPGSNCITGTVPNVVYNPSDENATCSIITELDAIF